MLPSVYLWQQILLLINWAAEVGPSLWNTFHFLPRGYFWEVVVGVCCPALKILTLFQSNTYKVNVREYTPGDF